VVKQKQENLKNQEKRYRGARCWLHFANDVHRAVLRSDNRLYDKAHIFL